MRTVDQRNAYFWVWEGEPGFGQPHNYNAIFCRLTRPEFERELRDGALQCLRTARAIERIEVVTKFTDGGEDRVIWRHAEPLTLADYRRLADTLPDIEAAQQSPEGRKFLVFAQESVVNEQV